MDTQIECGNKSLLNILKCYLIIYRLHSIGSRQRLLQIVARKVYRGSLNLLKPMQKNQTFLRSLGAVHKVQILASLFCMCTEKTIFPFDLKLNGIWSWWQFSFRLSEPNEFPFSLKIERKTVTTTISHSILKEMEI